MHTHLVVVVNGWCHKRYKWPTFIVASSVQANVKLPKHSQARGRIPLYDSAFLTHLIFETLKWALSLENNNESAAKHSTQPPKWQSVSFMNLFSLPCVHRIPERFGMLLSLNESRCPDENSWFGNDAHLHLPAVWCWDDASLEFCSALPRYTAVFEGIVLGDAVSSSLGPA